MKQMASNLGLPFGEVVFVYNTRLAQEVGCWAETKNKGAAFHAAAFFAYFVEAKNLADSLVIEDIAISIGLDGETARNVIGQRLFKDQVAADWNLAVGNGIKAVPSFMINQERMVGAQSYEKLKNLMFRHKVPLKE